MRPPENLYHQNIAEDHSRSSCSLNRCNLSPWIIGSEEFQANPLPVEIDGARTTDGSLFRRLHEISEAEERGRLFHDYVCIKFGLNEKIERRGKTKFVYSYLNLLRAWGADSNRQAGAVLKAWVESRFGILATYHNGRLADNAAAREAFLVDRTSGAARSIGVLMQLDLLYTFCQDELRRRFPDVRSQTLYRGTHDPEEYAIRAQSDQISHPSRRVMLVQLNNLSSFSSDPEVAWEFGSSAWEVEVPLAKIVFFSGLLPKSLLSGESEHLVLGGYYTVRTLLC
ncbi:MAG: NAD(+)--dinitrogen-reductase ADP-D-ribosyltransferase [Verrucomicrobiota bacterium]|jgi:NAD+--dinitrogen-reductase ADP-D-ribosyltransferase